MFQELKRFVSSMDLAIILIAALSGLSISATLFDTPEVFHSTPFRILVGLFFLNLLTCSLKLLPGVFRTLKRDVHFIMGKEKTFEKTRLTKEELLTYLKEKRYHVSTEGDFIFASKNKLAYLAPHILHMGLLIIIVGSFLTTFQTTDTVKFSAGEKLNLPSSIESRIGKGEIKLDSFETLYDEKGALKNWVSTFDLKVEGWGEYQDASTKVNHPFKKQGLSIYQMAYSNEYLFNIEGDESVEGDYVFPEGQMIPLRIDSGASIVQIRPMAENLSLFYVFDENGNQKSESALKVGDVFTLDNGLTLKFEKNIDFTVLQMKYNPYLPVVFLGFVIASLACMLFWLGRYRELWAFTDSEEGIFLKIVSKSKDLKEEIFIDLNNEEGEIN